MSDGFDKIVRLERLRRSYTRTIFGCLFFATVPMGLVAYVLTKRRLLAGDIVWIIVWGGGFAGAALYSLYARRRTIRRIDFELQMLNDSCEDTSA